jgi:molecular chaperone DnaK
MTHVGIDLGTTFSAISYIDAIGNPCIVPVKEGDRICPSLVYKSGPNNFKVGQIAASMAETEPEKVAGNFKRGMPFDKVISLDGKEYTAIHMSSMILKKLKNDFESTHGPITSAAITIPANWQEAGRQATLLAAEKAGLPTKDIINEPTAALLAIAKNKPLSGIVAVYDLGGGTFDVTIAKVNGSDVEVLSSEGDSNLGGRDFDLALLRHASAKFEEENGVPLVQNTSTSNSVEFRRWQHKFETAKKNLSVLDKTDIVLHRSGYNPFILTVTCHEFDAMISVLLDRADALVDVALDRAGISAGDVSEIVLVGGSTRIPNVRSRITRTFGKEPFEAGVNVDECVCLGAAILAGVKAPKTTLTLVQKSALEPVSMKDITPAFFGIIAEGGPERNNEEFNSIILEKDKPLPYTKTDVFQTCFEGQRSVLCRITQCGYEESDPNNVEIVGELEMELPAGRDIKDEITVTYTYDENGIMHCEFRDTISGNTAKYAHAHTTSSKKDDGINLEDFMID